jgi:branched-chain amino acid transport system permease protein
MDSHRVTLRRVGPIAVLAVAGFGWIVTGQLSPYHLDLAVTILTYLVIAQAWNILGGYAGQISLGAAAFAGIGGYAGALLMIHTAASWPLGMVAGGLAGLVLALVISVPLLRLRGDYFAVGSLAAAVALEAWMENWQWAGGTIGLTLPFEKVPSLAVLFRVAIVIAAFASLAVLYVKNSTFGLRLTAIRDNEEAAEGLGVSAYRHRLAALVLSSCLTGLAGALVAIQATAIEPSGMFSLAWSLNALLMCIVGGAGTFTGPVIGVLVIYYGLTKQFQGAQTLAIAIEGALLIVIVRYAPSGIWPTLLRLAARLRPRAKVAGTVQASRVRPRDPGSAAAPSEEPEAATIDAEIV